MSLLKTYWNDLLEPAKNALVKFYKADIKHCNNCPGRWLMPPPPEDKRSCRIICSVLFRLEHHFVGLCPCRSYGPKAAMAALEKAIADSEWEED